MNGLVAADPAHVPASTSMDVAAQPVQSYGYDHDILMEAKEDGVINDPPMPIVRALSHDHSYVNNENEDYQILRDFLSLGHEIGVAVDVDDEELDALVSTFDFGQLGRQTSYLDTYGDLAPLLSDGEGVEMEEEAQYQDMDEVSQEQSEETQDEVPSTSVQFSYPSSPEEESVSNSSFSLPATTPKPKGTRKQKGSTSSSGLVKDEKYWERRKKNNVASARSRKTRKQRAAETEAERQKLELINRHLKEEIAQLTSQVDDHKRRFFAVFKK